MAVSTSWGPFWADPRRKKKAGDSRINVAVGKGSLSVSCQISKVQVSTEPSITTICIYTNI